jgi:hypothetical protein
LRTTATTSRRPGREEPRQGSQVVLWGEKGITVTITITITI